MGFNFPNAPTSGETYTPAGGPTYTWDGIAWKAVVQGVPVTVYVSDTPPPQPAIGQLWWNSANGTMSIWYADADSAQWVQVSGSVSAAPAEPKLLAVRKTTANNTPLMFTEFDLTKYKTYQFYFENLAFTNVGSGTTEFGFQVSADGGATWLTSHAVGRIVLQVGITGSPPTQVFSTATHGVMANNFNNSVAMNGDMRLTVGHFPGASWRVDHMVASGTYMAQYGTYRGGSAIFTNPAAIRFFFIESAVFFNWNTVANVDGRILMYGMPR
jgi:hypothetical protein